MLEPRFDNPMFPLRKRIVDTAMSGIKDYFAEKKHSLSYGQWEGIQEIVNAIGGMALQEQAPQLDAMYYLSALPCGIGKTRAVIETIKAIRAIPELNDTSFIVFLNQLNQIKAIVDELKLPVDEFSVITNEKADVFKLGNPNKKEARVLFTTQQMLGRRVTRKDGKLKNFADIADYHYKGKPRQVRVWDEAISPAQVITLELDKVMLLPDALQKVDHELAGLVRSLVAELLQAKHDDLIEMPDLSQFKETHLAKALDTTKDNQKTIEDLFLLDGRFARVKMDNFKKTTTLQYVDIMPDDIKPLLILDAGAIQSIAYEWWHEWRKDIQGLKSPQKDFGGLTIHHWDRGSGRNTLSKKNKKQEYQEIADGIASAIDNDIPTDEQVLVVYSKPDRAMANLETEIRDRLKSGDRVKFLTWGSHTATNDFRDFKYIFLSSLWYHPEAQYEGEVQAYKGQAIEVQPTADEKRLARNSSLAGHILQAACRGAIRKAENGACPSGCHLYMVYSTKKGLEGKDFLDGIFPGHVYESWRGQWKLAPIKQDIVDTLIEYAGLGVPISIRGICQKFGLKRHRFLDYLEEVEKYLFQVRGYEVINDGEELGIIKANNPF